LFFSIIKEKIKKENKPSAQRKIGKEEWVHAVNEREKKKSSSRLRKKKKKQFVPSPRRSDQVARSGGQKKEGGVALKPPGKSDKGGIVRGRSR